MKSRGEVTFIQTPDGRWTWFICGGNGQAVAMSGFGRAVPRGSNVGDFAGLRDARRNLETLVSLAKSAEHHAVKGKTVRVVK